MRRVAFPIVIATVAFWLCLAGESRAVNMVLNSDFEACPIIALPSNGNSNTNCGWGFANFAGVETEGSGKVVRLETNGLATLDSTAEQTVMGLAIGSQYRLSWDRKVRVPFSGLTNGPSFGVFLDSQAFGSALFLLPTGTNNSAFLTEFVDFTATATTHTFIFAGELDGRTNGGGTTDISHRLDNVCLDALGGECGGTAQAPIPEPSTMLLLGSGLAGLAWWRKRRMR